MKLLLETLFLFIIITSQLLSQTVLDTTKFTGKDRINKEGKKQLNTKFRSLDNERLNQFDVRQNDFKIPLNLKIYQKIFADEKFNEFIFSQEERESGLINEDLTTFRNNKKLTQRMLSDIYGEDIINLKKILEGLGITKDQIVMIAAILKFFLYNPLL